MRADRKLIDEVKVAIIMGLWAAADVAAIAPLCWDAKIMVLSLAAADSLTQLPHQGYLARTQPSTSLQGRQFGHFAVGEGARHVFIMMPQAAFTDSTIKNIAAICEPKGIKISSLVYDAKKTGFRIELDEVMRAKADKALEGRRATRGGKGTNSEAASGPCKFAGNGDLAAPIFRVSIVRGGASETSKIL